MTDSLAGGPDPARLETIVDDSLEYLKNPDENVQTKGARILSALARTSEHALASSGHAATNKPR